MEERKGSCVNWSWFKGRTLRVQEQWGLMTGISSIQHRQHAWERTEKQVLCWQYQAFWVINCQADNEELQKNHRETGKQANGGKSASPGTCQMTQEGKSSVDDSNPLLICELAVTAQKKNAEVTANRPLKLLVDYALASKDVLGIIKKATSNKLQQNF